MEKAIDKAGTVPDVVSAHPVDSVTAHNGEETDEGTNVRNVERAPNAVDPAPTAFGPAPNAVGKHMNPLY